MGYGGKWAPVCAKGWNDGWTDSACGQLGFHGAHEMTATELLSAGAHVALNESVSPVEISLQGAVHDSDEACDGGKVVSLNCGALGKS